MPGEGPPVDGAVGTAQEARGLQRIPRFVRNKAVSGIGQARGQSPRYCTIPGRYRGEGIDRWLLTRKNRKNKKKDEPQNTEASSHNGNPFKRDRTIPGTATVFSHSPSGARRKRIHLWECGVHCCREGRPLKVNPKERDAEVPVKGICRDWQKSGRGEKRRWKALPERNK